MNSIAVVSEHCVHSMYTVKVVLVILYSLSSDPFDLEHLLPQLMRLQMDPKWQSLGKALSLNEDCLDEILTNNETDETRLSEMLEVYMMRPDMKHSWEEMEEAVKKVTCISETTKEGASVSDLKEQRDDQLPCPNYCKL